MKKAIQFSPAHLYRSGRPDRNPDFLRFHRRCPAQAICLSRGNASGAGTPDLSFLTPQASCHRWPKRMARTGRQAYIHARFTFDVAWPLVYTFFLVTAMSWLFQRGFPPESPWQLANLVPLLAALFDFLENITTSWVMARFPEPAPLAGILASLATPLKWTLVGGSVLLLFVGIAAAVMSKAKRKQ